MSKKYLSFIRFIKTNKRENSRLSRNGHLYKMDTSVKRTLRVGPGLSLLLFFTLYKTGVSLRRTLNTGPKGVRL